MVAPEDAKVSVLTATAMRGANVYEGLRAYWDEVRDNLFVWKLAQHLERLFVNMKIMRMTSPYGFDEHRPEEIEIGAGMAGGAAPTTTPSGTAFTSASAVGGASTTIRFRPG